MDDFNISLVAGLDSAKSKENINQDIDTIRKSLKELSLQAKIDSEQVKKLEGQLDTLKVKLNDAQFTQSALDNLVKQINTALSGIKIGNINIGSQAQQVGQQIGHQIGQQVNQSVTQAVSKATNSVKRSFAELHSVMTGDDKNAKIIAPVLDNNGFVKAEETLSAIENKYKEFGKVKFTNIKFDNGELKSFKVNIEQINGELKETRSFLMEISGIGVPNSKKTLFFPDDTIKGAKTYIHHLDQVKNATNETGEELNRQKEKLAEQAKYYDKLKDDTKLLYNLKQKLLSADESETVELNKQIKAAKQRVSYSNKQIDKKGLRDNTLDREVNDLVNSTDKKLNVKFAEALDSTSSSFTTLKAKWQEQGILVDDFKTKVETLEKSLNNISADDVSGLNAIKQQLSALSSEADNLVKVNKIQLSYETGGYQSQVDSLVAKTNQWVDANGNAKISTESLQTALSNLETAYNNLNSNSGNTVANQQALIEAEKALDIEVKKVKSSITSMNSTMAKSSSIDSLRAKVQKFYDINTATHRIWGSELKTIINQLASGADIPITKLRELNQQFINIQNSARVAGKLGKSFFDTLKSGMKSFSYWTSSTYIVMKAITEVKQAVNSVTELDTALVDLKKTTSMTASQLEEFYYTSNDIAKQMGVTTKEIIDQASAWSRLGYSSNEAATKMAKYSSMFASISPGMDIDTATDGLLSIMKAFDIGNDNPDDVLDGIMSKINIIGNTAGTSNAEIVNMLTKSSSAMKEANNTLEETIALETAAVEITRDDDSVGTAFKTLSMRIRGYDEETESYTNNVKELSGEIADLTKTASNPNGISLFTDDTKTTYKSTYQILKDISEIYDELDDKTQAQLLEKLAGKRQGQIIAATINNFQAAEKAMDSMANSAGSAETEMSIIMDSIEYKSNKLKETGTGIAQNLFKRDDMKLVLDFLNGIGTALDGLTQFTGLFGSIGLGVGLFAGIKNVGIGMLVAY